MQRATARSSSPAGTQAYLTKPIDLRRLLEIFDQFLAVDREAVPASVE